MISKLFIGGPRELEQYRQEVLDGILDFEIDKGNWTYTYHDRMVNYPIDNQEKVKEKFSFNQIEFVINELKRNPSSRRAVVLVRDPSIDAFDGDPACFCANTKIKTPQGEKNIEDLKDGDSVYAYDLTNNCYIESPISNTFFKKDDVYEIKTDFNNIRVSKDQLIYTLNGWIKAKDLTTNDKILYSNVNVDNNFNLYHLIGCLHGDGWLTSNDGCIGFSIHPEADITPVVKLFQAFTNNKISFRENFIKSEVVKNGGLSKKCEIYDKALWEKLKYFVPTGHKTHTEMLLNIDNMTTDDIISFLIGIYSSEGSIVKRGVNGYSIQLGMNWKQCIDFIAKCLDKINISYGRYESNGTYKIYIQNIDSILHFIQAGIDFRFDTRKQSKFEIVKKKYLIVNTYQIRSIPKLEEDNINNASFIPIRSVDFIGQDNVYDFTIEHNDHAIIANNLVCHNCLQHIQYFIRDNKLHCKVLFRSNDACKANFMNMFALILLQKRIADKLGLEVGTYTHRANSFHCYEKDFHMLDKYIEAIEDPMAENEYEYIGDWDEIMEEYQPEIAKEVEKLKNQ